MNNYFLKKNIFFLCLILILTCFCQRVNAHPDEEISLLRMYYKEEELVVTPTRNPKPISQVAENITIITLDEIEAMNAHTLKDILNNIPGVQMDLRGGPGSGSNALIQGSEYKHVLLMIDGIVLNNLSSGFADFGAMPVQNIGRIEIIKGPASSSWGSSLGGVINIITKAAGNSEKTEGTISQSGGEKKTLDSRIELYKKAGKLGYYLFAETLDSDGFVLNTSSSLRHLYTKLNWDAADRASLLFTLGYTQGSRGDGAWPIFDLSINNEVHYLFSKLRLNYLINNKADLILSFKTLKSRQKLCYNQFSTKILYNNNIYKETSHTMTAKIKWKYSVHNLVLGVDFEDKKLESDETVILDGRQDLEKWGFFTNDTITIDKFSITPGIRYDHATIYEDLLSPSIGVCYILAKKTIVKGTLAKGHNTPPLMEIYSTGPYKPNLDLEAEKIWSIQAGIESTALKYFWFKTTLFRHNIRDAIDIVDFPEDPLYEISVNKGRQRKQGFEVEIKTIPIFHTSLSAGYVLIDAKDQNTGERIPDIPRYTYDTGIQYNTNNSFTTSLRGHYINWYNDPETPFPGKYKTFIWDMNLMKRIHQGDKQKMEAFFTAHNIFNCSQYRDERCKNPRRWIEGGIRCKF